MDFKQTLENECGYLSDGIKSASHPFQHFVLSNSINNDPESRIVILRTINKQKRFIGFNTDKRSPKYNALLNNKNVSALFYDQKRKIQLRIKGNANVADGKKIQSLWDNMALESRLCYMGKFEPSSVIELYEPNMPSQKITEISDEEYALGFKNFIHFKIEIDSIDWLYLHSSGHKRVRYKWDNKKFSASWLAT